MLSCSCILPFLRISEGVSKLAFVLEALNKFKRVERETRHHSSRQSFSLSCIQSLPLKLTLTSNGSSFEKLGNSSDGIRAANDFATPKCSAEVKDDAERPQNCCWQLLQI